jgi:hypothetical protein
VDAKGRITAAASVTIPPGTSAAVIPGGRLTVVSGNPVPSINTFGAMTLYYTAFVHNVVGLWDTVALIWTPVTFTEISLALGTVTANLPYDVFCSLSGGVAALSLGAWSSGSARSAALALTDGRYVLASNKAYLYLGTIYTVTTTTTEDSQQKRFVYNHYNQRPRFLTCSSTTGHSYNGGWRMWNNDPSQFVAFVLGFEQASQASVAGEIAATGANIQGPMGIGQDSAAPSTVFNYVYSTGALVNLGMTNAQVLNFGIGYHYLNSMERGIGVTNFTDQALYCSILA